MFVLFVLMSQTMVVVYAQMGIISGRVIDANSLQALPFATVYINNTTTGVTATEMGEFSLPSLPIGKTEIVFSFLGYIPQQLTVVVTEKNTPLLIRLNPNAQQITEVNIKASRDKTWEKQFRRFEKAFLGNTSACKILNPWVINFGEEQGFETASAQLPIEIENKNLGYKIVYQLKQGRYSAIGFTFLGTARFTELETTSSAVALDWMKEREHAFQGSLRHLLKSILDRQSYQQGFRLYRDKEKGRPRSSSFSYELEHNLLPLDTTTLVRPLSTNNEYQIVLKDRLEVHDLNTFVSPNFYSDGNDAVSWIETRRGYIAVSKEGILLNPADVAVSGTMADARISEMLPLNYQSGSVVTVQKPMIRQYRRLQEAIYLHTDKPYYYPGDKVWFSAYMKYRLPGLMDSLSQVLYIDLINSERIITQHRILLINKGRASGSFTLGTDLPPGQYLMRAYTQWMRNYGIENFFYKAVPIIALHQRVDQATSPPVADTSIKLQFDQPTYERRATVKMRLSLDTTGEEKATKGSFSIAVIDETTTPLVDQSYAKITAFGLPAITQTPESFPFSIEQGITLRGVYTDRKGKPKKATVVLLPDNFSGIHQAVTSDAGMFTVSNLVFYDSTIFLTQPIEGKVKLLYTTPPNLPENLPSLRLPLVFSTAVHRISSSDTFPTKTLNEVMVMGKQLASSKNTYAHPDFYLKQEKMNGYASVAEALAALSPSFKLVHDQTSWYLLWARSSVPTSQGDLASHEPNLYINDVLVIGETVGDRLMQLNPSLIDHIEANGMISANQGANGSNGLINVYMKQTAEGRPRDLPFVKARGFDYATTFQFPDYNYLGSSSLLTDYRSTVYWNPILTLTSKPLELSFTTSDQTGHYRVIIEGITEKGTTIHSEALLTVHN